MARQTSKRAKINNTPAISTTSDNPAEKLQTLHNKKEQERTLRKKALFIQNFLKSKGILGPAAKATKISRQQVHAWRKEDPAFAEMYNEAEIAACEFVESEMIKQIKSGNTTLTIFYLVNRSKGRYENIQKVEHKADESQLGKIDQLLDKASRILGANK
jgi:hypothetical protein